MKSTAIRSYHGNGWIYVRHRKEATVLQVRSFRLLKRFRAIFVTTLSMAAFILAIACVIPQAQKGGTASTIIRQAGHTNIASVAQSANPKEPSRQTVFSEQLLEYVLPPGTAIELGDQAALTPSADRGGASSQPARTVARLDQPVPVRLVAKDRTETSIGGAQKDLAREWASKAATMQPVMWAGIIMMTLIASVFVYFRWWTKAAVAAAVGVGMIVVAQTLPEHGTAILFGGLGCFAMVSLLVLYAYHKGLLDYQGMKVARE